MAKLTPPEEARDLAERLQASLKRPEVKALTNGNDRTALWAQLEALRGRLPDPERGGPLASALATDVCDTCGAPRPGPTGRCPPCLQRENQGVGR